MSQCNLLQNDSHSGSIQVCIVPFRHPFFFFLNTIKKHHKGMNESKLLKNHNKCPMITTNLNEKKMQNSQFCNLSKFYIQKPLGLWKTQFLDYHLIIINMPWRTQRKAHFCLRFCISWYIYLKQESLLLHYKLLGFLP